MRELLRLRFAGFVLLLCYVCLLLTQFDYLEIFLFSDVMIYDTT